MKTKRTVISIFTLCTALLFTACSGKGTSNTDASRDTQIEAGSEASGSSNTTLDDLYQQENQLFAEHEDAWNKAFGMMNKSTADPSGNYADYLAATVESNKDSFTDDELKNTYILPDAFDNRVVEAVSKAVYEEAIKENIIRK